MLSLGIKQMCRATLSTANMAETAASFGRVMKCYGMHWTCIERLWPPEIAVERSRMSRMRRIAVDKPPDMLGVCEKIGESRSTLRIVKPNEALESVVDYRWTG